MKIGEKQRNAFRSDTQSDLSVSRNHLLRELNWSVDDDIIIMAHSLNSAENDTQDTEVYELVNGILVR